MVPHDAGHIMRQPARQAHENHVDTRFGDAVTQVDDPSTAA